MHGRVLSGRGICRVACHSSFRMCPIGLDLKPLANCFFMFLSAEQISNHGRILNGRMHVYIIYMSVTDESRSML